MRRGSQIRCRWLALVLVLAPAAAAPAVRRAEVALGGPEVIKLDWNMRALQAADLDGDGR